MTNLSKTLSKLLLLAQSAQPDIKLYFLQNNQFYIDISSRILRTCKSVNLVDYSIMYISCLILRKTNSPLSPSVLVVPLANLFLIFHCLRLSTMKIINKLFNFLSILSSKTNLNVLVFVLVKKEGV